MKRRTLLRRIGTASVGGVALSGMAGAQTPKAGSIDAATARRALAGHEDLLESLAADGLLDEASVDALDLDAHSLPATRLTASR